MATLLIPTIARDVHAAAVALALEQQGHRAIRWFCADFPEQCSISMSPDGDAPTQLAVGDALNTNILPYLDPTDSPASYTAQNASAPWRWNTG